MKVINSDENIQVLPRCSHADKKIPEPLVEKGKKVSNKFNILKVTINTNGGVNKFR
jgi:hypothetical protein